MPELPAELPVDQPTDPPVARKPKKHVYRPGDRVVITNPLFVDRVGYPVVWTDLYEKFQTHPELRAAMIKLGISHKNYMNHSSTSAYQDTYEKSRNEFAKGCARAMVYESGFGGSERSIHATLHEQYRSQEVEVISKRCVRTGNYYAPSGGYDYYGEWDHEDGGLSNARTHVLLTIDVWMKRKHGSRGATDMVEIEECHVIPISASSSVCREDCGLDF